MINPLQQQQIKKLNKQGNDDLQRKVAEIIDFLNETMPQKRSQEKKKTSIDTDAIKTMNASHNAIFEFTEAILEDIEESIILNEQRKLYQNEFDKLERRYRNDQICFWIGLLLFGVLVADVILIIF